MEDIVLAVQPTNYDSDQERGPIASGQSLPSGLENEQGDEANNLVNLSRSQWDPQNFESLITLGKGNYATVYLVESSQTRQLYAMKLRSKRLLQMVSDTESINTEKAVLLLAKREKHPFVVEVFGGFQTESHIMIYLEFCQGGDLMHHVNTGEKFDMKRARFYAAEVCLALKWFHDMNLLYRSLSLSDILLGLDGHIKLVDFVVSKVDIRPESRTNTFCGSSEFMAPEILLDRPYNSSIDWWQLGIITYQMLTQLSPFQGDNEDEIYDSILADEPSFPAHMTIDTIDFVQNLLSKEPETRLGSGTNGAVKVMTHAFFREINWDDLYYKRVPAPFVPTIANCTDTSNFDSEFTVLDTESIVGTQEALAPEAQEMFRGFEFSAE